MVRRAGGAWSAQPPQSHLPRLALAMSATSAALLRACSLLLCLVAGSRQLSIKEFVVPNAAEVGTNAELRCQYELGEGETEDALYVKWWWTPDSSSSDDRKQIYQRIAGQVAESIHQDDASKIDIKDSDTIVLLDVHPVDSGTYECEVSNIEEIRKHDTLVVYTSGTGPEVNYTLIKSEAENEEDKLLIECEADAVAPLPDLAITLQGGNVNVSQFVEDTDQDGLYKIYANASISTGSIEEGEIRCELFFNSSFEHPQYVDVETYIPPGVAPRAPAPPEAAPAPDAAPDSLQNSSDDGIRLRCSGLLLTFAAVLAYLQAAL